MNYYVNFIILHKQIHIQILFLNLNITIEIIIIIISLISYVNTFQDIYVLQVIYM